MPGNRYGEHVLGQKTRSLDAYKRFIADVNKQIRELETGWVIEDGPAWNGGSIVFRNLNNGRQCDTIPRCVAAAIAGRANAPAPVQRAPVPEVRQERRAERQPTNAELLARFHEDATPIRRMVFTDNGPFDAPPVKVKVEAAEEVVDTTPFYGNEAPVTPFKEPKKEEQGCVSTTGRVDSLYN